MLCNFTMIDRVSSIRIRSDAIEKKVLGSELPFLVPSKYQEFLVTNFDLKTFASRQFRRMNLKTKE